MEELEHETDPLTPHLRLLLVGQRSHVAPCKVVGTAGGAVEQAENVEQRGFARPGRPHQADVLAGADAERHLAQGVHRLVAYLEYAADARKLDHEPG